MSATKCENGPISCKGTKKKKKKKRETDEAGYGDGSNCLKVVKNPRIEPAFWSPLGKGDDGDDSLARSGHAAFADGDGGIVLVGGRKGCGEISGRSVGRCVSEFRYVSDPFWT